MIELKDFIRECLMQIVEGVGEAQAQTEGAVICPPQLGLRHGGSELAEKGLISSSSGLAQLVEFDVALNASEGSDSKAKVGVIGGVFGGSVAAGSQDSRTTISRVKFIVPVALKSARERRTAEALS